MTQISKEARNNILFGAAVIVAVTLCIVLFDICLNLQLDKYYKLHKLSCYRATGFATKDKGNYIIRRSLDDNALMLCGSSELTSTVPQNHIHGFFPNDKFAFPMSNIGHAYVQNLLHGMNFGANFWMNQQPKIAIVESLQWFTGSDINVEGFLANFSELHFYQFLRNRRISDKNKKYLAERFYHIYIYMVIAVLLRLLHLLQKKMDQKALSTNLRQSLQRKIL